MSKFHFGPGSPTKTIFTNFRVFLRKNSGNLGISSETTIPGISSETTIPEIVRASSCELLRVR